MVGVGVHVGPGILTRVAVGVGVLSCRGGEARALVAVKTAIKPPIINAAQNVSCLIRYYRALWLPRYLDLRFAR